MNDLLSRQIIPVRQQGDCRRLYIALPVFSLQQLHLPITLCSHLNPCISLNAVVNTIMARHKTTEHGRVGRIDNSINGKSRYITLPNRQTVTNDGNLVKTNNPLLLSPLTQIRILDSQYFGTHGSGHADIHENSQKLPFSVPFCRYTYLFIFLGLSLKSLH